MFDEHGELQARLEDGGDDVSDPVTPVAGLVVAELRLGVDVCSWRVEAFWFWLLEIRVAEYPFVRSLFIEGQQNGMPFAKEEPATRA